MSKTKNNGAKEKYEFLSKAYARMGNLRERASLQSVKRAMREDPPRIQHVRSCDKKAGRYKVRPSVLRRYLQNLHHKAE